MSQVAQGRHVWDLPVRLFHWINVAALLGLVGIGLVILNAGALGVDTEGKILLKQAHVLTGYVFVTNLAIRLAWGFVGGRHARWSSILPFGKTWRARLKAHLAARSRGETLHYLGHNPLGQVSVLVLFLLLLNQAVTGLFLAGSDLYWPPFGGLLAEQVAAPGVDPESLRPYAEEMVDPAAYAEMREMRKPFVTLHVYGFYTLLAMILLHVAAVVHAELRSGGALVSAMITGRKHLPGRAVDAPEKEGQDR